MPINAESALGCLPLWLHHKIGEKKRKKFHELWPPRGCIQKIPLKTLLFTQQDVSSRIVLGYKISPK